MDKPTGDAECPAYIDCAHAIEKAMNEKVAHMTLTMMRTLMVPSASQVRTTMTTILLPQKRRLL
jgi:hypothetical protein